MTPSTPPNGAEHTSAASKDERVVKCRQYRHGGARFYTVGANGREHLLADTYNGKATERVAAALNAEIEIKVYGT